MLEGLLDGRIALVTGGTSGVGEAIALRIAREGARGVAIVGRDGERGGWVVRAIEEAGAAGLFVSAELSDVEQAAATVHHCLERFGRIDCVVNAAALNARGSLLDTTSELFDAHMAINVRAPFFIMQQAVADMRRRGEPGSIVNIITMSAHGGQPYLAPYAVSKGALVTLTKNAAYAHRWDRIRVNGLNIGWSATPNEDRIQREAHGAGEDWLAQAEASVPMGRLGRPEEIADMVVLLLSDRAGVVTGSVIDWDQVVIGPYD
jgi:NAD(P)-dependent dehydrogenase (short-subunit alcohol dehydrogenase family)